MSHPDMRLAADEHGVPRLIQYFPLCGVWAVTPYTACDLRCSYCVTFSQGRSTPRLTANIREAILREVQALPPDATLAVGGLVDAYPTVEEDIGITREVLQALATTGRRVIIITKGPTVTRDIDLLRAGNMRVCISISSLDDAELKRIEPHVASASDRRSAIETLAGAAVDVCLQAQPWIPGITDARAMIAWADGRFPVSFTPLIVDSPGVARTPLGRRFTQQAVNHAYLLERQRVGHHPSVVWHKPLWIGTSELQALSLEPWVQSTYNVTDIQRRNLAAVLRLLGAFREGAQFEALLGFISPYARLTDETGHAGDRDYPESGRAYDLLYALHEVLDDPVFSVKRLSAIGDTVDLRLEISGIHARPLFDIQPGGEFITLPLEFCYAFDRQGLVVDYIQRADLDRLMPGSLRRKAT